MSTLSVKNLSMQFGDFIAVDNVSFEATSGSFITLLGPSGCGKTTLLKMLAGFLKPANGSIEIAGKDITSLTPENRDTAMCFQSYALFPHLTVEENIGFGPKQLGLPIKEQRSRVDDAIAQVELEQNRTKLPNALSGGQQQRVALARALAMRSSVILFDEPLSNLDAQLRDTVRHEIRTLQKNRGFTAVYVTHDQAEALAMSDQIIVMNKGHIEQIGSPYDIYNRPRTEFVANFIGAANIMAGKLSASKGSHVYETNIGALEVATDEETPPSTTLLSWRPEEAAILPSDQKHDTNCVEFLILGRVFQGSTTTLNVAHEGAPDHTYRIDVLGQCPLEDGSKITVQIKPENIVNLEEAQIGDAQ